MALIRCTFQFRLYLSLCILRIRIIYEMDENITFEFFFFFPMSTVRLKRIIVLCACLVPEYAVQVKIIYKFYVQLKSRFPELIFFRMIISWRANVDRPYGHCGIIIIFQASSSFCEFPLTPFTAPYS